MSRQRRRMQQLSAGGDVTIQVQGSTVVPNRTVVIDEEEDDRFADNQYTITAVKVAEPGDELEVNVGAPDDFSYNVELFDTDLDRLTFRSGEGDDTATFDTGDIDDEELDPGMYVLGVVSGGEAHAAFPVIISAYDAEITDVSPDEPKTGDTLEVWAEVEEVADDPPAIEDVMLGGLTEDDDTAIAVRMDEDNDRYHAAVADPPAGDYQFHVAPRSDVDVSFPFDPLTSTELSSTGVESDDTQVGTMTEADGSELLGLSPGRDVEVELSDTDALEQRWSVQSTVHSSAVTGGLQFSRPAVDNENVFVGGVDEFVTGHARNSGEERWNFEREGNLSDVSPVLHDGVLYVGSGGGYLYAIDADDGSQNWKHATDGPSASEELSAVTSTPAVYGVSVFFAANNGVVHRVDDKGDEPDGIWATDVGAGVISDVEIAEVYNVPVVIVTTTDGRVVTLDAYGLVEGAGDVLFDESAPVDSFGASSPVFDADNGLLYVAGDWLHAIDLEETVDQQEAVFAWQYKEYGGTAGSDPRVSPDGYAVYVGSADGKVNALSTENGDVLWQFETGDAVAASPAVTSDRVVAPSLDGTVYVIDRATGTKEHSRSFTDGLRTEPVILNDNVYLGTEGGDLLKLQNIP